MGFLDNSGDIILDAVLTDTGRMRLSKGDGSFRISKFAFGDDEIDYTLYDKNNASGSAYYDITILQTPVLEAFTDNTTMLKSKLMSLNRTGILYLPMIKPYAAGDSAVHSGTGVYVLAVDQNTVETSLVTLSDGILNGYKPADSTHHIEVDQGLDTTELPSAQTLAMDLVETSYIVEVDNRLMTIYSATANSQASPSFVDDDNIASYYFTQTGAGGYITNILPGPGVGTSIRGPRGTKFSFRLGSSLEVLSSVFPFTELGSLATVALANPDGTELAASTYRFIDTTVRVTGVSTGYRVDLPIRLVKKI